MHSKFHIIAKENESKEGRTDLGEQLRVVPVVTEKRGQQLQETHETVIIIIPTPVPNVPKTPIIPEK